MEITAQIISQHLGTRIYIEYSIFTLVGVPVSMGTDWVLFDNGAMVWTPAITTLTTEIPKVVRIPKVSTHLPVDLGDLFK